MKYAVNVMFTQIQVTQGFNLFRERKVDTMIKELKQFEEGPMPGKKIMTAIDPDILYAEKKEKEKNDVNLIKWIRDKTIKGITCADGRNHKRYLGKYESVALPTVSMESLLTALVLYVYKERDISTFGIPGAYLHADIPAGKM